MSRVKSKLSSGASGSSVHSRCIRVRPILPRLAMFVRNPFQPTLVLEIPGHRESESGGEIVPRFPTQLTVDFGRIDGIPAIMARPISYERDQIPRIATQIRTPFVDQIANSFHDAQVRPFVVPADIVSLARPALLQYAPSASA